MLYLHIPGTLHLRPVREELLDLRIVPHMGIEIVENAGQHARDGGPQFTEQRACLFVDLGKLYTHRP